jgi:hypothetical protein
VFYTPRQTDLLLMLRRHTISLWFEEVNGVKMKDVNNDYD